MEDKEVGAFVFKLRSVIAISGFKLVSPYRPAGSWLVSTAILP